MSNYPIYQHYVPQFYLKNFSNKNKKEYITTCYDIENNKSYPSNIRKIAEGKNFYTKNSHKIEEKFNIIETKASKIINNIAKHKKIKYLNNMDNRIDLATFLALQDIRTNETRKTFQEQNKKICEYLDKYELEGDMSKFREFVDEDNIRLFHLDFINQDQGKYISLFLLKKWSLIYNKTDTPFLTSDNPLVKFNPNGKIGLLCDHIHIFFPITSKLCLCLLDPYNYSNYEKIKEYDTTNEMLNNTTKVSTSKIKSDEKIDLINRHQIQYATKHIFSKNNQNDYITNLIDKYSINTTNKNRIEMKVLKNASNNNDVLFFYNPEDKEYYPFDE